MWSGAHINLSNVTSSSFIHSPAVMKTAAGWLSGGMFYVGGIGRRPRDDRCTVQQPFLNTALDVCHWLKRPALEQGRDYTSNNQKRFNKSHDVKITIYLVNSFGVYIL